MLVEYARNVLGAQAAEHAETSPEAGDLVVTPLACSLWGQEHPVSLVRGTRAARLYGAESAVEDYFCSYGLSPEYRPRMEEAGLRVSGVDEGASPASSSSRAIRSSSRRSSASRRAHGRARRTRSSRAWPTRLLSPGS